MPRYEVIIITRPERVKKIWITEIYILITVPVKAVEEWKTEEKHEEVWERLQKRFITFFFFFLVILLEDTTLIIWPVSTIVNLDSGWEPLLLLFVVPTTVVL